MKINGLEVQKILFEPKATLQTITLKKQDLTSCFGALFIICASTLISRQWGSSEMSSGIFQLYVIRVDSALAGSKKKTFLRLPAELAGELVQTHHLGYHQASHRVAAAQTDLRCFCVGVVGKPSNEATIYITNYPALVSPLIFLFLHKQRTLASGAVKILGFLPHYLHSKY